MEMSIFQEIRETIQQKTARTLNPHHVRAISQKEKPPLRRFSLFGGLGRVKYAPRAPNIIRAPENILWNKRFLGKRRSPLSVVLFAIANCWRKAVLRRGGGGGNWTHVLLGCQKTFYILSSSTFLIPATRRNTLYSTQVAEYSLKNTTRSPKEFSVWMTPRPQPTDKSGATFR